jgi:hypothetical protein
LFKLVRFVQFIICGGALQKTVAGSGCVEGGRWRRTVEEIREEGEVVAWKKKRKRECVVCER